MTQPRPLIAGNWKMNGVAASLGEARALADALRAAPARARVALCVPPTLVERLSRAVAGSDVLVGGETCHAEATGAHTGDVSAEMLADAGAVLVIVGHSERRAAHGETDAVVAAQARAALRAGLEPIVCVGESLRQRDGGEALAVIRAQVQASLPAELAGRAFALAYEPVWAIGTGRTASLDQIAEAHAALRAALRAHLGEASDAAPILYGGSVNGDNARAILGAAEVGGALVGGASLRCADFLPIVCAAGPPGG